MSGVYRGVQACIKEINSLAEFVPCSAPSLNLVGNKVADCCVLCVCPFLELCNVCIISFPTPSLLGCVYAV